MLTLETNREIVILSNCLLIKGDSTRQYVYKLEDFTLKNLTDGLVIIGHKTENIGIYININDIIMILLNE